MHTTKIFGPPGTGKTRRLLELLEAEIKKGTPPNRIGFLTFTRAARVEALQRTGMTEDDFPYLRTIHAVCYRQLGVTQGQIVKPKDLREFGSQIGIRLSGTNNNPWDMEGYFGVAAPTRDDLLLQLNHLGRHRLVNLNESLKTADLEIDLKYAKWFTLAYYNWKQQEALLDYTDLLSEYLKYGEPLPIDVLFVDEAQDLSRLQWQVVHRLSGNAGRVYFAGDDDQTIFAWAGASSDALIDEPANDIQYLERSNRVPRSIVEVANGILSRISRRAQKPWLPKEGHEGEVGHLAFLDESALKNPSTFVLFRNHHRGRELKQQLEDMAWPFVGEGSFLSEPKIQRAIQGWVDLYTHKKPVNSSTARAMVDYAHDEALNKEMLNAIKKDGTRLWNHGDIFKEAFLPNQFFRVLSDIPGRDYLAKVASRHGFSALAVPKTSLISIHQSKGREADTVILDTALARKTYDAWWQNPEDEHRVWYVAVTRSMNKLLTLMPEETMVYPL
jgi:superfamily I DNA/RNA helicase